MTSLIGKRARQKLGSYRLMHLIGQGGFAEVYLGEHIYLHTQAAIKVLHTQFSKEDQESFLKEARTIARLKHPNILPVLEFGVEEGVPFLIMDNAPKGSLRERYRRDGPLPTPIVVLPYIKQVAAALQYAHEENVIHRDIKPENMLLGTHDEVLLSDFGMALGTQSSRTQDMGDVAGTVAYMAPELLQGRPSPASDQYALGVVVYEWLSGKWPFYGTFTEIASQHVLVPPPPIKAPAVSPEVEAVIFKALAKAAEQRFESVQAFATAFEQATMEVEGTFRAQSGWLPKSVYEQIQTVSGVEGQSTLREDPLPTQVKLPTGQTETVPSLVERTQRYKSPSRILALVLATFALLIIISGIVLTYFSIRTANDPQVQAAATVTAWQNRYTRVTGGKPFLNDSLSKNVNGLYSAAAHCAFKGGTYHAFTAAPYTTAFCGFSSNKPSNIACQVQMTINKGNEGGIGFRASNATKTHPVLFYIFALNRDGTYTLIVFDGTSKILLHRSSAAIRVGLKQSNLLTIIAQGKQITLYINRHYIASISDDTSTSGLIFLFAESLPDATDVSFSNAQVWRL
jgi:eukaryotic-like serine/threonine-protein kinase